MRDTRPPAGLHACHREREGMAEAVGQHAIEQQVVDARPAQVAGRQAVGKRLAAGHELRGRLVVARSAHRAGEVVQRRIGIGQRRAELGGQRKRQVRVGGLGTTGLEGEGSAVHRLPRGRPGGAGVVVLGNPNKRPGKPTTMVTVGIALSRATTVRRSNGPPRSAVPCTPGWAQFRSTLPRMSATRR
jgi:hypothetical protein